MILISTLAAALSSAAPPVQCNRELNGSFCDCIPETYEDAIRCIGVVLDEVNEAELRSYRFADLSTLHHGFGTGMRNAWLRSNRSPAQADMIERGFLHADDMSAAIIEGYWALHNGCDIDLDLTIAFYTTYWHAAATNALERNPGRADRIVVPTMDHAPVTEFPIPVCPFPIDQPPPAGFANMERQ